MPYSSLRRTTGAVVAALAVFVVAERAAAAGAKEKDKDKDKAPTASVEQKEEVKRTTKSRKDFSRPSGLGLDLFGGLGLGYAYLDPEGSEESVKTGMHLDLIGYLAAYTDQVELDLGGGYVRNELSGSSDTRVNEAGEEVEGEDVTVITNVGNIYVAGNLNVTSRWQVGLVGQMMLGADASFSPDENKKHQDPASFLGGQLLYTWPLGDWRGRIGVRLLTDVNIVERQLAIASLTAAVGLPIIARKTLMVDEKVRERREETRHETIEKTVPRYKPMALFVLVFDEAIINFPLASSGLSERSKTMLKEIGAYLGGEGKGLWQQLVVEGHTDKRGSAELNLELSRTRAASVRAALVDGGAPGDRIDSVGYGFDQPSDTGDSEIALARNRRVELKFQSSADEQTLPTALKRILTKYK